MGFALPVVEQYDATCNDSQAFVGTEFHYMFVATNQEIKGDLRSQAREGARFSVGGDHAAKWETSYLMYLHPDCVDMSIYLGRDEESLIGIMGKDPRKEASTEIGQNACNIIVQGMVLKAKELIGAL